MIWSNIQVTTIKLSFCHFFLFLDIYWFRFLNALSLLPRNKWSSIYQAIFTCQNAFYLGVKINNFLFSIAIIFITAIIFKTFIKIKNSLHFTKIIVPCVISLLISIQLCTFLLYTTEQCLHWVYWRKAENCFLISLRLYIFVIYSLNSKHYYVWNSIHVLWSNPVKFTCLNFTHKTEVTPRNKCLQLQKWSPLELLKCCFLS